MNGLFGAGSGMSVYGAPKGLADFGFSPARAGGMKSEI